MWKKKKKKKIKRLLLLLRLPLFSMMQLKRKVVAAFSWLCRYRISFFFFGCVCVFFLELKFWLSHWWSLHFCSAFDSFMQFQDCSDFWEEFQSSCKCAPDGSLTFFLSLLHAGASESAAAVLFNSRVLWIFVSWKGSERRVSVSCSTKLFVFFWLFSDVFPLGLTSYLLHKSVCIWHLGLSGKRRNSHILFFSLRSDVLLHLGLYRMFDHLKKFSIEALMNAVDQLGNVVYKLNDLLAQQTTCVTAAELRTAALAQVINNSHMHVHALLHYSKILHTHSNVYQTSSLFFFFFFAFCEFLLKLQQISDHAQIWGQLCFVLFCFVWGGVVAFSFLPRSLQLWGIEAAIHCEEHACQL